MSVISRITQFAERAAPDHADRPRTVAPSWLLLPGLIALGVCLAVYVYVLKLDPSFGLDLRMYRGSLQAFVDGKPVYQLGYTSLNLPYTYPPITLLFLMPLIWGDHDFAMKLMNTVGVGAMIAALWFTARTLGYRAGAGRVGLVAAVAAVLVWTEPLQSNLELGQVNILVMLAVVYDLSLPDRSRFKGIGIGLAAASKLLPGLFIVYLILTRRIRAAITAAAAFVALTAAGFIVSPSGSYDYWIRGLAFDSHRVLMGPGPRYVANQSLQGFTARLLGTDEQNTAVWMLSVVVVAVAGLALAVRVQRHGEEAMAMAVVACTMLLISPVSWSHYWVWIGPLALVLVDVARRATGRTQIIAAGVAAAALLPFLTWPLGNPRLSSGHVGFIWASKRHSGIVGHLMADPYVPTVLALFVLAAWWVHRSAPRSALLAPLTAVRPRQGSASAVRNLTEEGRQGQGVGSVAATGAEGGQTDDPAREKAVDRA